MTCKICRAESYVLYTDLFDDRYGYPGRFTVYQCRRCLFGQVQPELTMEQLDQMYTNYYPRKNVTVDEVRASVGYRPGMLATIRRWSDGINNTCHYYIAPDTKVLDIGCGNGASLLEIQAQGAVAFGTEADRNVEPIAKALNLNIRFGHNAEQEFPDNFFDAITMSQLLEHIPQPVNFLKRVKVKLKPNGKIIMSFPNINSFNRKRSGRKWINWHIPYHLNFFSRQSLTRLADQAGLQLETIKTMTPNVWLQLQHRANYYQTTEGSPSPIWVTTSLINSTAASANQPRQSRLHSMWNAGIGLLKSYLTTSYVRLQDRLGRGDSFLVIMRK